MRKFLAYLMALVLAIGVIPAYALGERGGVTIIETPNDAIDEVFEDNPLFYDDEEEEDEEWVVFDPVEEYLYDADLITEAMDTLDGIHNILLLGVDSRTDKIEGRTDTMILLTVDPKNKTIKMTSFLRDLYVEIPGKKNNRLNAAYVFGGFDLLAKTLEKNFGVKPDAYVAVNLSSLVKIIDELGGLYIDVDKNKIDRINAVIYHYNDQVLGLNNLKDGYLTKGGYQLLNGKQAEAWARYRYSESDYQRSQRQRQLIEMIFSKIKEMSVVELISFAMKNAYLVETNLSISEIISLAPAVLALHNAEIREMRIPIDNGATSQMISGMSVIVPDRQKNYNALKEFLEAK